MKRFSLILMSVVISSVAIAQNMPKAGYNAIGFSISGLSNTGAGNFANTILANATISDPQGIFGGFDMPLNSIIPQQAIMYKRYYDGGWASRMQLGINSMSAKTFMGDSTFVPEEYATTDISVKGMSIGLGLGMEKHMETEAAKVDPFIGADLLFGFLTGFSYTSLYESTSPDYNTSSEYNAEYPGGLGIGLNLFGGFNYFFSDNISIGAEVGLGYGMVKTGGEWTAENTYIYTDNITNTSTTTVSSDRGEIENADSGFQVNTRGNLNLIVYW